MSKVLPTMTSLEPTAFVSQYALATLTNSGTGQYVARSRQLRRKADVALFSEAHLNAATKRLRLALEAIADGAGGVSSAQEIARSALAEPAGQA